MQHTPGQVLWDFLLPPKTVNFAVQNGFQKWMELVLTEYVILSYKNETDSDSISW